MPDFKQIMPGNPVPCVNIGQMGRPTRFNAPIISACANDESREQQTRMRSSVGSSAEKSCSDKRESFGL
jgi:hypothetical protein